MFAFIKLCNIFIIKKMKTIVITRSFFVSFLPLFPVRVKIWHDVRKVYNLHKINNFENICFSYTNVDHE